MEKNVFRLLVYAIIAAVLLYLFFFHFAPLYLWKEEPAEAVKKQLKKAETQLGHYSHQPSGFPEEFTVQAPGYESPSRSINFECNDEILCCPEGKDCERAIEWDNSGERRYFSFKEYKPVEVSARCRYEDIYICKVFIGREPAQVKITEMELEDAELDLMEKKSTKIRYRVKNTGKKDMIAVQGIAKLYKIKKLPFGQEPEKVFIREFKDEEFPLETGAGARREIEISIEENGDYLIELTVSETTDETNYEKEEVELKAHGLVEIGECIPRVPLEEWYSEIECRYYLPCEDCKSIEECKRKWREELGLPWDFDEFGIEEIGEDIILTVDGEYTEGNECETLCYSDWDVIRELEKSETPLEVFIVLDASGSMRLEVNALKNTIWQMVEELKGGCQTEKGDPCIRMGIYVLEGFDYAFALGRFDYGTGFEACTQNCPVAYENDVGQIRVTRNLDSIADSLSMIGAMGGVEPWADIVIYSLKEDLGWNPESYKAIIVMTDEMTNCGIYTVADAIAEIQSHGGTVNGYGVWSELSGPSGASFPELEQLASQTGGITEHYLLETEIPGLLLKIIVHAVRNTARARDIKFCDEDICPKECSCDWWSYPGKPEGEKPRCSEEECEECAKEKCLPVCVLPGTEHIPTKKYEPEEKCIATECLEDRDSCKTWLLCECQCILEHEGCYEMCREQWTERLNNPELEVKLDPDSARSYIEGECSETNEEGKCEECELPKIEGCIKDEITTSCEALEMDCECKLTVRKKKILSRGKEVTLIESPDLGEGHYVGKEIQTVQFPEGRSFGVGVAFDGEFLYYSQSQQSQSQNLFKIRPDGTGHETIQISGFPRWTGLGALSYDAKRKKLWAGTYGPITLESVLPIYLIDPETGDATHMFSAPPEYYTVPLVDGLAYDATDDTIWFSADVSPQIVHYSTDGTVLEVIDLTKIHPDLSKNSGIAIGGSNFYLGTDGFCTTIRVDKESREVVDVFVNTDYRIEDIECDPVTFAPVEVVWIRDAYNGTARAYEIEPGTCGLGGMPPETEIEEIVEEEGEIICTYTYHCSGCPSIEECIALWREKDDSIPEEVNVRNQNTFSITVPAEEVDIEECEVVRVEEEPEIVELGEEPEGPTVEWEEPVVEEPVEGCEECSCVWKYREEEDYTFMNLLFVLDLSGSMKPEKDFMAQHIETILEASKQECDRLGIEREKCLKAGIRFLFGIDISYMGGEKKPKFIRKEWITLEDISYVWGGKDITSDVGITPEIGKITQALKEAYNSHGGDEPEPWAGEALVGIHESNWDDSSRKAIIIMSDAPNNPEEPLFDVPSEEYTVALGQRKYEYSKYIPADITPEHNNDPAITAFKNQAVERGIKVFAVYSTKNVVLSEPDMKWIAENTNGRAISYVMFGPQEAWSMAVNIMRLNTLKEKLEEIPRVLVELETNLPECTEELCGKCYEGGGAD